MKKVIKIIGGLVIIAVLFLNVSLNKTDSNIKIDLSELTAINKAEAECYPYNGRFPGTCDFDECDYDYGTHDPDCDPTQGK